jgi:hypothetical protein
MGAALSRNRQNCDGVRKRQRPAHPTRLPWICINASCRAPLIFFSNNKANISAETHNALEGVLIAWVDVDRIEEVLWKPHSSPPRGSRSSRFDRHSARGLIGAVHAAKAPSLLPDNRVPYALQA